MSPNTLRALLVLTGVLTSLLVAVIAAWLVWSTGSLFQNVILAAGGTFGGTLTLILLVLDKTRTLP